MEIQNKELIQLKQLPFSKGDIADFSKKIEEILDGGEVKASDLLLRFKGIEKVFESVKKKLTESVVNEISFYPKGEAILHNTEFKIIEAGISYDFSECGDPSWESLNQQLESIKASIKKREDFLKTIKDHETIVDEVSGEILTIYPPVRKSSTTIKVNIK